MNRPRKENARYILFKLRLNQDEYDTLCKCSEVMSKPKSHIIREALKSVYRENDISLTDNKSDVQPTLPGF